LKQYEHLPITFESEGTINSKFKGRIEVKLTNYYSTSGDVYQLFKTCLKKILFETFLKHWKLSKQKEEFVSTFRNYIHLVWLTMFRRLPWSQLFKILNKNIFDIGLSFCVRTGPKLLKLKQFFSAVIQL
jgi:hypothetical protein